MTDPEILETILRRSASGSAAVCQELVSLANARGGHDNVTALVLNVVEAPASAVARGGTVVEAPLARGAGSTLVADDRRKGTLSDADAPAPTLYDDGTLGPRPTQPGITELERGDRATQPGDAPPTLPRFSQDEPPPFAAHPSSRRLLVMLGIALALTLVGGVLAWAAVSFMHRSHPNDGVSDDEPVPPPAPPPPRRWRQRNVAPLGSAEEPEPPPSAEVPPEDAERFRGAFPRAGELPFA